MVWFHGGGDDNGSGHQSIYDLVGLADATGNVIVSVNSRLGFLGFMALPELREESSDASTGNYHHLDQIAALQWVQDNISAFNGDPANVTIFGESAGANDVCRHLSSRLSDGLFQRAILQSSTCGPLVLKPLAERYVQGEFFKTTWGCEDSGTPLDCLRTQSAVDLRQALDDAGKSGNLLGGGLLDQEVFRPAAAIDDYVFTAAPLQAMAASPNDVEVIVGVNLNEFTFFQVAEGNDNPDNTLTSYQQLVRDTLAGVSETDIVELTTNLYPCSAHATCSDAFSDLFGDAIFACPSIATADALVANGNTVRFYEFTQPINGGALLNALAPVLDDNAPQLGVPHSADLFYLWNLPALQAGNDPAATVTAMQQYWGSFASEGEPVSAGNPSWPLYTDNGAEYLEIGETISARSGFKIAKCDFINARQLGFGQS